MNRILSVALFLASVHAAAPSSAQYDYGGWGRQYHHASTAAEGYARGIADLVRSRGEANLRNAQALAAIEEARAKYLDNRLRATEAYYERQRIRDQYHEDRKAKSRYYLAKQAAKLAPLTKEELDPDSGKITWPQLLTEPQFAEDRRVFAEIFARRAANGIVSNDDYLRAVNRSRDWRQRLTEQRDEYVFSELRNAILFIRRLVEELSL